MHTFNLIVTGIVAIWLVSLWKLQAIVLQLKPVRVTRKG